MVRSKIGSKTFVAMLEAPSAGGPVPTTRSPGSTAAAYKLIEATARKHSTHGATENGAGGPTGIFPFLDNAVPPRALEGVAASRIQGVHDGNHRDDGRSPSREPGRGGRGHSPRPKARASPGAHLAPNGGVSESGGFPSPPRNPGGAGIGLKEVLNERAVRQLGTGLKAFQEQIIDYFPEASAYLRDGGSSLSLDDVDPILADAVQAVFEAQIDIFHAVVRTLQALSPSSRQAAVALDHLDVRVLPRTVARAMKAANSAADGSALPSPLDRLIGIPPFGAVAAEYLAPLLLELSSGIEGTLIDACKAVSITETAAGLTFELGSLRAVLGEVTAGVDPSVLKEPMNILMQLISDKRGVVFRTRNMDWGLTAHGLLDADAPRQRSGRGPTVDEFMNVAERLEAAEIEAARAADVAFRAGGGGGGGASRPIFAVAAGPAATSPTKAPAVGEEDFLDEAIYLVRSHSPRTKCSVAKCTGMNPPGSLLCTTCCAFQQRVYFCKCGFPVRIGERCRIYFCDGVPESQRSSSIGNGDAAGQAKLKAFGKTWVERFTEAAERRRAANGGN